MRQSEVDRALNRWFDIEEFLPTCSRSEASEAKKEQKEIEEFLLDEARLLHGFFKIDKRIAALKDIVGFQTDRDYMMYIGGLAITGGGVPFSYGKEESTKLPDGDFLPDFDPTK